MRFSIIVLIGFAVGSIYADYTNYPHEMKSLMDTSVKPCDDFYRFSCGQWLDQHHLKSMEKHIDASYSVIDKKNLQVYKDIMNQNRPFLDEFWSSCMAYDKLTAMNNKPLQNDLNRIVKAKGKDDVLKLAGEFSRSGTNTFAKLIVGADKSNAKMNILHINIATLGMEYDSHTRRSEYGMYINKLMKLTGFSDETLGRPLAEIVMDIERLAKISNRKKRMIRTPIAQAKHDWPNAIGAYLRGAGLFTSTTITDDTEIYIDSTYYFDDVEEFIRNIGINDLKVYIAFIMVHSRIQWLGEKFINLYNMYFSPKTEDGQELPTPRDRFCINKAIEYFPDLMGKYYYLNAFDHKREKIAVKMFESIKDAMMDHISNSTWFGIDTTLEAKDKLSNVIDLIGQSDMPMSFPYTLSPHDYPSNINKILEHSFKTTIKKIGQKVKREEWEKSAATANAFYSLRKNTVTFPAAILQPPFFDGSNVHPARNYGAIGSLMGHELTHGFDTEGRYYDAYGNVHTWWTEFTDYAFTTRAECMTKQYSGFHVKGVNNDVLGKVNGDLTLYENIADNGGVSLAWDAYRKYIKDKPMLHNVDPAEADRMFFIAYAQSHCSKTQDEDMIDELITRRQSPSQWRVNGVVMNSKDFVSAFGCTPHAPMNPYEKCRIW